MISSFLIPFISICIAEFLDKSQLAILLLSSRIKHHFILFLGTILAFAIVDGSAILIGSVLTTFIPKIFLTLGAGILFIIFGILTLRSSNEEEKAVSIKKTAFISGFLAVFFSEWGDKTQIASAVFATQYDPLLVFGGVMTALALLSLGAIYAGKILLKKFKRDQVERIAGITFLVIGLYLLAQFILAVL